jgi:hypothetical protein
MDEVIKIKQKFDDSLMWISNEGDGEMMIQVRLVSDDGESNAVIWLDSDQRKDLIEILQRMEN